MTTTGWIVDGLLTADDVAGLLRLPNGRAVDRLRRAGRIVGVRVGRSWRYTRDDVDDYVAQHRVVPGVERVALHTMGSTVGRIETVRTTPAGVEVTARLDGAL